MEVVICAIAKNEHRYINDWVKWHLAIGFDRIYVFDNDDNDKPFIGDFIDNKDKVEIINARGLSGKHIQTHLYTDFYNAYGNTFDWCMFVDIDEFLNGTHNIKTFLDNRLYDKFAQIRIKWRLFGDDDLITRNMNDPVWWVFHKQVFSSKNRDLIHKGTLENQGKFIVKGGLHNLIINSPHYASKVNGCYPSGKECHSGVVLKEPYVGEQLWINHYMTKSLSEFIEQKLNRSDAVYGYNININYYWRINKINKEKIEYLKERGIWL